MAKSHHTVYRRILTGIFYKVTILIIFSSIMYIALHHFNFIRRLLYVYYKDANGARSTLKIINLDEPGVLQTKFSNMSDEEFEQLLLPHIDWVCSRDSGYSVSTVSRDLPDRFDWRDLHVVGPVQNQKGCNGCWAFSIVGAMETMLAKTNPPNRLHPKITTLSVQQVIDCSTSNKGCRRGDVMTALDYLYGNHVKIVTEAEYPLELVDENCKLVKNKSGVGIKNFTSLCFPSPEQVLSVVATHGPAVALVNARTWRNYIDGIITTGCDDKSLNHVVQIVGYDLRHREPYYIVRNSWGEDFGRGGYLYIAVGHNVCGIESNIYYLDVN